jgi:hypothetical protein
MMALSGVRSSWLMLARNCDLCLLATSSWALVLDLVEQPHVLDRDDSLVGEGRGQLDLPSLNGRTSSAAGSPDRAAFAQRHSSTVHSRLFCTSTCAYSDPPARRA